METALEQLRRAAILIRDHAGSGQAELATRADRLAERLGKGQFHLAVTGEFKAGKSTLINALLGQEVLPAGVLPVTAIATEVAFGPPAAEVASLDGTARPVGLGSIRDYVSESANPDNRLGIELVRVKVPCPLLRTGAVLVDTPGIGSVHKEGSETAIRTVGQTDGAVLVLRADAPLSQGEKDLAATLASRQVPTFYVLGKCDHHGPAQLEEIRRFVESGLGEVLGQDPQVFCVAARPVLEARVAGGDVGREGGEFLAFEERLGRFVDVELAGTRAATARQELGRLAHGLQDSLHLEEAARRLDHTNLSHKTRQLADAASRQLKDFEDACVLLERDVGRLRAQMAERLRASVAEALPAATTKLEAVAETCPVRALGTALDQAIEASVREHFDAVRATEADAMESAWSGMARRFGAQTEARVNALRQEAATLFGVELPHLELPPIADEGTSFYYLFLQVGHSAEDLSRLARSLIPPRLARTRLLRSAVARLGDELDKHAGRASWDLGQRLDTLRVALVASMREELSGSAEALLGATRRARTITEAVAREQLELEGLSAAAGHAISEAIALAEGTAGDQGQDHHGPA